MIMLIDSSTITTTPNHLSSGVKNTQLSVSDCGVCIFSSWLRRQEVSLSCELAELLFVQEILRKKCFFLSLPLGG